MAASVGNLAIIISGNARPFNQALKGVQNNINQASRDINNYRVTINPPRDPSTGLRWSSAGRFVQSAFVMGFGGGLAGAVAGVFVGMAGQLAGAVGHTFASAGRMAVEFLADAVREGMELSRSVLALNVLSGGQGDKFLTFLRGLSATSGYDLKQLSGGLRTLTGNMDDMGNALPTMLAVTKIVGAVGGDADSLARMAKGVSDVFAAGRAEAQDINQLTEHGLPLAELAKTAGMQVGEFRRHMKEGAVSADVLAQTLNRLALSPGGKFFDFLNKQADSAVGQMMKVEAQWKLFKQELGVGIMEGLKEGGFFNAIQSGLSYLLEHKGEIKSFLNDMLDQVKRIAVGTARWAGDMYDVAQSLRDAVRQSGVLSGLLEASVLGLGGSGASMKGVLGGLLGLDDLELRHTGDELAKKVEEAFKTTAAPAIQEALDQIKLRPKLSPEAQKLLDSIRKDITEGATPFDKFQRGMSLLKEARDFAPKREEEFRKGLGGAFGGLLPADVQQGLLDEFRKANPGVNEAEFQKGVFDLFQKLESEFGHVFDKFPAAMQAGSQEAASAISHAVYGSANMTVNERVAALTQAGNEQRRQMKDYMKKIADAVDGQGTTILGFKIPGS